MRLVPDGQTVPNEVAARFALRVITYRPGRVAAKIACPILFCVCETDSVAPATSRTHSNASSPTNSLCSTGT
jgi:uncharacterized protein